ncbi:MULTISPECIES: ABC1 kinase family protein [Thermodesulfovibrio]|jgi:ubiquinone biosynthesis protein|uniref:ABC transporter n=1 Tax=Thermodesulfovibrio yellowstonii (strain ATCC 51303 / DSM 11347 / YP87) TaxID=289376 RepID=B5YJJ0_THEYD|nr:MULTISPECIES: AarF/ABC1/UbiB kinase family protein [Thermodesulfovibrio]ACI20778.1 ABC transporter [Thermodesulfovibrio yellowstonii DSM 11347]
MDILRIKKTYFSAKRLQEIINVFLKHGFGQIIDQIHLGRFIGLKKRIRSFGRWPYYKVPTIAERLRIAFEELGPTFIKLGQLLASRPDMVTLNYAKEFKKLQDRVPPFKVEVVYEIIEKELGISIEKVFQSFNPEPIGSASIAQVHEATLMNGERVIVKVRRPGIKEQIMLDLSILQTLAKLVEKYISESKLFDPVGIVDEFSKSITKELDFRREARNAIIFKEKFKNEEKVYIPHVFREFTTEKILVMEKVDGIRIDDKESIKEKGLNIETLLNTLIDIYFKQIFDYGFFHGDPHPGNILVRDDGRIALVDFGIVQRIDEEFKEAYANVALAIINQNTEQLITEYLKLGIIPEDIDREKIKKELKEDIEELLFPIYTYRIEEIKISELIESIMRVCLKHRLRFLPELLLIDKVLIMLEGLTRELCPKISIIELLKPYARKIISKRLHPEFYLNKTFKALREFRDALEHIPFQFKTLLKKAVRDEITVRMYHVNLPEFIKDIDKASNKIAFSLIVSAMILSSAIMHANQVKPLIYGISLFGLITGVFAFFLGLWLIISIIRSGKL